MGLTERPAHRLVGRVWEGPYGEAASAGVQQALAEARSRSSARTGLWKSPVVALSWDLGEGGLRFFAGFVPDDEERDGSDLDALDVPELTFASSWHGPQDGGVLEHYGALLRWMRDEGHRRLEGSFAQREEYPPGTAASAESGMRLMIPIAVAG